MLYYVTYYPPLCPLRMAEGALDEPLLQDLEQRASSIILLGTPRAFHLAKQQRTQNTTTSKEVSGSSSQSRNSTNSSLSFTVHVDHLSPDINS